MLMSRVQRKAPPPGYLFLELLTNGMLPFLTNCVLHDFATEPSQTSGTWAWEHGQDVLTEMDINVLVATILHQRVWESRAMHNQFLTDGS
jgi:hypothetical protein